MSMFCIEVSVLFVSILRNDHYILMTRLDVFSIYIRFTTNCMATTMTNRVAQIFQEYYIAQFENENLEL